MEQLFTAFGIDARLLIVQIINFVILLAALTYFLYRPVLNFLAEREERIAQGIKDAEAAAAARSATEAERQDVLTAAHSEATAISERAAEHAKTAAAESKAAAEAAAARIIEDAEVKGGELQAKLKLESEAEIAKLAVLAAEKILREKETAS
jgi:F-type H+-transporting ATPase subunit b